MKKLILLLGLCYTTVTFGANWYTVFNATNYGSCTTNIYLGWYRCDGSYISRMQSWSLPAHGGGITYTWTTSTGPYGQCPPATEIGTLWWETADGRHDLLHPMATGEVMYYNTDGNCSGVWTNGCVPNTWYITLKVRNNDTVYHIYQATKTTGTNVPVSIKVPYLATYTGINPGEYGTVTYPISIGCSSTNTWEQTNGIALTVVPNAPYDGYTSWYTNGGGAFSAGKTYEPVLAGMPGTVGNWGPSGGGISTSNGAGGGSSGGSQDVGTGSYLGTTNSTPVVVGGTNILWSNPTNESIVNAEGFSTLFKEIAKGNDINSKGFGGIHNDLLSLSNAVAGISTGGGGSSNSAASWTNTMTFGQGIGVSNLLSWALNTNGQSAQLLSSISNALYGWDGTQSPIGYLTNLARIMVQELATNNTYGQTGTNLLSQIASNTASMLTNSAATNLVATNVLANVGTNYASAKALTDSTLNPFKDAIDAAKETIPNAGTWASGGGQAVDLDLGGGQVMHATLMPTEFAPVWSFAYKFASWLLAIVFVVKVVKDAYLVVQTAGTAQQMSAPMFDFSIFGIGGNWGVAMGPVILTAMLSVYGATLGWLATQITDTNVAWSTIISNPLSDSGYSTAVMNGIAFLLDFFPVTYAISLMFAYIFYRLTLTWMCASMVVIFRALMGN